MGTILRDNDNPVTEKGICWNTTGFPTTSDNRIVADDAAGVQYNLDLTELTPGETYYVRAYAENSAGTGYGNQLIFSAQMPGAGNRLSFDGLDDVVEIGDPFADPTGFTISMWVKPAIINDGSSHGIIGYDDTYRKPSLWLGPADGSLHYDSDDATGTGFSGTINNVFLAADEWVHITWVKEGSSYLFYRNGVLISTAPAPAAIWTDSQSPYYIGRVDSYFEGELDEVAIYSQGLSGVEVTDGYAAPLSGTETGLTAYYGCNQSSGNLLVDSSPAANHGVLENYPQWTPWTTPNAPNVGINTVWVDDDYSEFATNDGLAFGIECFAALKPALQAVLDGGTVIIRDGEYKGENNRELLLNHRTITIRSENGADRVIINPENETISFWLKNSDSTIEGLTIFSGPMLVHDSSPLITNCTFFKNRNQNGGAIQFFGETITTAPIISASTFVANQAENGGAIFAADNTSLSIINSVFLDNQATVGNGGALAVQPLNGSTDPAEINVVNCTFLQNTATTGGDSLWVSADSTASQTATATITNSILWGSDNQVLLEDGGAATISYSAVQNGYSGTGNTSDSPDLIYSGDPHLKGDSPCVDAGTNSPPGGLPPTDLYGNDRVINGTPDMGAHEAQAGMPLISTSKSTFYFTAIENEADPADQSMLLHNSGDGNQLYQISDTCPWLTIAPNSGSLSSYSAWINLHVDTDQLPFGQYTCFFKITSYWATNSPRTIPVHVNIRKQLVVDQSDPDAFTTIQAAIDAAEDGETVLVRDGTYTGSGNTNLSLHDGFGSFKAITVRSENGPTMTIIDCEGNSNCRGISFNHDETAEVVLEGFTFRNGSASVGGGISLSGDAAPTIRDCVIEHSQADTYGGGVFVRDTAHPTLINCRIENNSALDGGGISCTDTAEPLIINTLIINNAASQLNGHGGGLYLEEYSTPRLTNTTIAGNSAMRGMALYNNSARAVTLRNCIIWNNGDIGAGAAPVDGTDTAITSISYSTIEGGHSGNENLDLDPLFRDTAAGDYRLEPDSPCMNSGNNSAPDLAEHDFSGRDRILEGQVDMGPFEHGAEDSLYLITDIPDQTFSPGNDIYFTLFSDHWGTGDNLAINYGYSVAWGNPVGTIFLDPETGKFSCIVPEVEPNDPHDNWRPFALTFHATTNDEVVQQTITFNSGYQLPTENSLIESVWPMPDPENDAYIVKTEQSQVAADGLEFNYLSEPELDTIVLSGKTLEIEAGHDNGIHDHTHDRKTIESMTLYAETVVIRDPWHLPQTNVTIYARTLRFEDDGQINTVPVEKTDRAENATYDLDENGVLIPDKDEDENGVPKPEGAYKYQPAGTASDGLPAGSLSLWVDELETGYTGDAAEPPILFKLNGGKGQRAGEGLNGIAGKNVTPLSFGPDEIYTCAANSDSGCRLPGLSPACKYLHADEFEPYTLDIYYCNPLLGSAWSRRCNDFARLCQPDWPSDGSDAISAGRPGAGGNGGHLTASINGDNGGWPLSTFLANNGGNPGDPGGDYIGGPAGTPTHSVAYDFLDPDHFEGIQHHHYTKDGWNTAAPTNIAGQSGQLHSAGHSYAWLHPYALKSILAHAKAVFLNGHPEEARVLLADYPDMIDAFLTAEPDSAYELDLMQLRDEILTILFKIDRGLDFFGNTKGWAPLLSFEVTRVAFQNEIEHALEVLYLNHWIRKAQDKSLVVVGALEESKNLLEEEIDQFKDDFIEAKEQLEQLSSQSWDINSQIELLREELNAKQQTINQTHSGFTALGSGVGMVSKLLSAVPKVGSLLSGGVNLLMSIGQNIPLDPHLVGTLYEDVSTNILKSDYPTKAEEVEEMFSSDTSLKEMLAKGEEIAKGLEIISDLMKDSEADPEVITSALNNLRGSYPFLSSTITKVTNLMDDKLEYATLIEDTMDTIASLPNMIANNRLAVTQVERHLSQTGEVLLEQGDMVYLAEMERRARERLIRYHYYMAKAYTYRMLAPYPDPHDLTHLLDEIIALVDADLSQADQRGYAPQYKLEADSADFEALEALFEEQLWTIADQILTDYLDARGGGELSTSVTLGLSEEEIATLNQDGEVIINLVDKGFFAPDKQDIRLVNLEIDQIAPLDPDHDFGAHASLEILMHHSGRSLLTSDGETHFFHHHNEFNNNGQISQIAWGATYDHRASTPGAEIINPISPSQAADSLLLTMLDANSLGDHIMIYSRPAAWADITLTAQSTTDTGEPIELAALDLKVTFDWSTRASGTQLTVRTGGAEILPQFLFGAEDLNGRKDGRGSFVRVFDSSLAEVELEAQRRLGPWSFDHWSNRRGDPPAAVSGDLTANLITVSLSSDCDVMAWYILDADNDGMEDNWEIEHFGAIDVADGTSDADDDGLTDLAEAKLGSNPNAPDTDGDGMPDSWEAEHGLNVLVDDSMDNADADAAPNWAECQGGTDPNDPDDIPQLDTVLEDFEKGDLSRFSWNTSGDGTWEVSPKNALIGAYSARSPLLSDGQSAILETEVLCEAGSLTFTFHNSSEYCGNVLCDGLVFSIDGNEVGQFTGDTGTQTVTYQVTAGQHTFSWQYSKDGDTSSGEDRAWIDNIWFPAALAALDTDDDGMLDSFEIGYNLNPFFNDAAEDSDGDNFSNSREFEAGTNPSDPSDYPPDGVAPAARTDAATMVTRSGAFITGTVNARNDSTTVTFEYGLTPAYGASVTADQSPITGSANTAMNKVISGLTDNTTYHYRVVAQNSFGTTYGVDRTFTTGGLTADLSVTKTASKLSVSPGESLTYTLIATNDGPDDATAATLTDTLSSMLKCSWSSVAAGGANGNSTSNSGNLTETLNMPAGSTVTYTATCTVSAAATETLINKAMITSTITDPFPDNNSATETLTMLTKKFNWSVFLPIIMNKAKER